MHVGSQLMHFGASLMTVDWIAHFAARLRAELDWTPRIVDLGGGLGARHVLEEPSFTIGEFVGGLVGELQRSFHLQGLPAPRARARAGPLARLARRRDAVLRRRRQARERGDDVRDGRRRHVRQPAPRDVQRALHGAAREPRGRAPTEAYAVAGKHCESGDVLIERVELPEPRRGDLLAVPVTGAYTLSMSSTYNAVTRPPAVLVADGKAHLIRRRETVEDLLALEA